MALWVIEADGKVKRFQEILKKAGIRGVGVFATGGHLFSAPQRLHPLGIDRNYQDVRNPVRQDRVEKLTFLAGLADHLIVATDPDDEGDVIAGDVARLVQKIRPDLPISRIRLQALSPAALTSALEKRGSVGEGVAGTVRRVFDRWIGGTFSRSQGVPVGRVFSAFLSVVSQTPLPLGRVVIRYPAKEGPPFLATVPLLAGKKDEWSARIRAFDSLLPVSPARVELRPRPAPFSFGDALLDLRRNAGMSVVEGARRIQSLYERGVLSYPRTDSRGLSPESAEDLLSLAKKAGLTGFDPARLPSLDPLSPHEALHPLGESIRISDRGDQTVVERISRRALYAGLPPFPVEIPAAESLPEWARSLGLFRPLHRLGPDREPMASAGILTDAPDAVVLQGLMAAGLGRPSTLPSHVGKILAQNVLDSDGRLTAKGRVYRDKTPGAISDPGLTAAMEGILKAMGQNGEGVKKTMEALLETLPGEIREQMETVLEDPLAPPETEIERNHAPSGIGLEWG